MANTGGLTAQVINLRNNQPIDNATVKLSGPVSQSATTGSDGKFNFSGLPAANDYVLDVAASGYESQHYEDIVVIEDNVTDLYRLPLFPEE